MRRAVALAVLSLAVTAAACGKNTEPPPPTTGRPGAQPESGPGRHHADMAPTSAPTGAPAAAGDPVAQARAMYGTACVMCHGEDGSGNGPAAGALDPKPRNYGDAAWQASVTDDQIKQIILKGGQGVGKSTMMPGHPELEAQPALLDALVQVVRGFGKK